jgi:prolyl-tRNA synthetase
MKWSQTHLYTFKEAPHDADIVSQQLFIRGGLIKKVAPGLFTYGPIFLKALRKFETIIRYELEKRGAIEILMPMVQPRSLWEETGRWVEMGEGLLKFKNRQDHWFCLGATHEEVVTDYMRFETKSHRDLPKNVYQIQTKYRDEIRPRFGLMRGREFLMKDAYSFDQDPESALKSYHLMYEAYQAIFDRLGIEYRIVEADAGHIGGSLTHEFQVLAEAGEDALLVSEGSDFAANIEVCPALEEETEKNQNPEFPLEEIATPGVKTIEQLSQFLKIAPQNLVKTLFFSSRELDPSVSDSSLKSLKPIAVLVRGDHELNPVKLKNILGLVNPPQMLTDQEVLEITGSLPGSCGPQGLSLPIYCDKSVSSMKNFIVGANKEGYHLKNVNLGRDIQVTHIVDLRMAQAGDRDPKNPQARLKGYRGIEVGHVFYLGTKYSEKMNLRYAAKDQSLKPVEMGCYGIGVTRTLQAVIEQSHDENGMIWPFSIAPYLVHICVLDPKHQDLVTLAEQYEKQLEAEGIDVFVDDREERPGVKFKDADLLGFPLRLTLGKKGFDQGLVELVVRKTGQKQELPLVEVVGTLSSLIKTESGL